MTMRARTLSGRHENEGEEACGTTSRGLVSRVGRTIVFTTLVVLSLLTFPSSLPWMIAFWLAWQTLAITRSKPPWMPLLTCVGILAVKRVYWPPTLIGFGGLALLVGIWSYFRPGAFSMRSRIGWTMTFALWIACALFALQWRAIATCGREVLLDTSRSVVCIGDSLTSGLLPDRGYPAQLQKMIRPDVINLGQSGIATEAGFGRLSRAAQLDPPPQLVILELGGHDFLQGRSRFATKANLERLIDKCRAMGAEVVLIEVPRGFMTDPFWGLEREIAHKKDVQLVADTAIRQLVLWSPISPPGMWFPEKHLSDDGIHSNRRGSEFVARHVADALQRMFGSEIRQ
jgi:lysophospholipase L1-like esterase